MNWSQTPSFIWSSATFISARIFSSNLLRKLVCPLQLLRLFAHFKFRRQHPIIYNNLQGLNSFFVADFYCSKAHLVIELDGKIHEFQKDYDQHRDYILAQLGLTTIRITNESLKTKQEKVLNEIFTFLTADKWLRNGIITGSSQRHRSPSLFCCENGEGDVRRTEDEAAFGHYYLSPTLYTSTICIIQGIICIGMHLLTKDVFKSTSRMDIKGWYL